MTTESIPGSDPELLSVSGVRNGMLRASIFTELPGLLRDMGHDPDPMLQAAGIDARLLADADNLIPFRIAGELLRLCVKHTGCQHFGLLLGQRGALATLSSISLMGRNAPDVGAALESLTKQLHHHDQGAVASLAVHGKSALLAYAMYEQDVPATDQISSAAMAISFRIMQELCGRSWRPAEVRLPFRTPQDLAPYRQFFAAPLRFNAEQAGLVFPAAWLGRSLEDASFLVASRVAAMLATREPLDLASRARRALRVTLAEGNASEEAIACGLGMSRRTLIRQLQRAGTSFNALLKEVRLGIACQLLSDTDNPVEYIAVSLGYANASSFARAFRNWTGHSPADWKRRQATKSIDGR